MTIRTASNGTCTVGVDDGGTYISNSSDYMYIKNGEVKINNNTLLTSAAIMDHSMDSWEYIGWFEAPTKTSSYEWQFTKAIPMNANTCGYYIVINTQMRLHNSAWIVASQNAYPFFIAQVKTNGSFSGYTVIKVSLNMNGADPVSMSADNYVTFGGYKSSQGLYNMSEAYRVYKGIITVNRNTNNF